MDSERDVNLWKKVKLRDFLDVNCLSSFNFEQGTKCAVVSVNKTSFKYIIYTRVMINYYSV